ncbi:MAG: alpha/beta hydrolase-fold protein [Gemmataceae bacterium]
MDPFWCVVAFWVDGVGIGQAPNFFLGRDFLDRVNRKLHGQVLDFTHNHGCDRRIWSPALGQKRDLYVYLPPGFDPKQRYPLAIFLHGAGQDEQFFIQAQVEHFDKAIMAGQMPPVIIAAPDGTLHGRVSATEPASFFANSKAGAFEDYVMIDVWNFVHETFPIKPERESHAIVGVSMGGSAAFAFAIKHRDRIKAAMGFFPLLNLRYVDCEGKYRSRFDPGCFGLRERFHGLEKLGRRKLVLLRFRDLFEPIFGRGPGAIAGMSAINPLELMERTDLKDGELDLYVAYGGKDEFNVAAQVESFLFFAKQRGVTVTVDYDPNGRHDLKTGLRMMPNALQWAAQKVVVQNQRRLGNTIFTSTPRERK